MRVMPEASLAQPSLSGNDPPLMLMSPPGPRGRDLRLRHNGASVPMGPPRLEARGSAELVMARGQGANVLDVDGNRYVDLAAGFGALILGHCHARVRDAVQRQSSTLLQALGDVYPSAPKVELLERLCALYPGRARAMLCQSGSDAVSAALKSAVLATGRPGVLAFGAAYHGLGYGPLAACGLRSGYREPFRDQLSPHVRFVDYPGSSVELDRVLSAVKAELAHGAIGAILVEPVLGRGGVIVPPTAFLPKLAELASQQGALLVADEIWTGLGRSGSLISSLEHVLPDLICLGKGLGGGVPISAVVGREDVLSRWRREPEVVHTSTFAGAPLACAAALATLDTIQEQALVERSREVGSSFLQKLGRALGPFESSVSVRGLGLMVGIDLGSGPGRGSALQAKLLERGYLTSTGGGQREVLVLTPPLDIDESLLEGFIQAVLPCLQELG